jgi:hypothetical protein
LQAEGSAPCITTWKDLFISPPTRRPPETIRDRHKKAQPTISSGLGQHVLRFVHEYTAEAEGLEPPRACARLISNQLPYQLDYASRDARRETRRTVKFS